MTETGAASVPGLAEIADIGRDTVRGGYSRHLFDEADRQLREWFVARAAGIGLDVDHDRNGNIWAWWGPPGPGALVTGSHLDSVPGGGAFDGPLGVVSALERGPAAHCQRLPAIPSGSRRGVRRGGGLALRRRLPRLEAAVGRTRCRHGAGADRCLGMHAGRGDGGSRTRPGRAGRDDALLSRIGLFLELHVEQGRGLIDLGVPVGVASSVLGHGRWRLRFAGQGNHAGTTLMSDRRDPMVAAGATIAQIADLARARAGARATVGRVDAAPGGTNVIASRVDVWLDSRAEEDEVTRALVAEIGAAAAAHAAAQGCTAELTEQSWSGTVHFPDGPRMAIREALGGVPALPTGAGHDAAVLAAAVPTAMLYVRNPTGISHAPEEFASAEDCAAGVDALETALRSLAGRS